MYPKIIKNRLLKAHGNPINLGPVREVPQWATQIATFPDFELELRTGGNGWLTVAGPHPASLPLLVEELAADRAAHGLESDATLDLTALVLSRGMTHTFYGGSYFRPLDEDTMHVLTCGINWESYRAPGSDRWSEFNGTFNEDDGYSDVLGGAFGCRCEDYPYSEYRWERVVRMGFEMPSIAELIVALSSNDLERLFGND